MFRGKYSSRIKVEKGSGTIRINQQIEESDSLTKNEELKQSGALEIRDEENTKSENVTTKSSICSEGSRVVQNQTCCIFPIFSWSTSTHLGHEVIKPKCLNTSKNFWASSVSGPVEVTNSCVQSL